MAKETVQTKSCTNSPLEKIHSLIHNASYQMKNGNIDEAQKLLSDADIMCHDEIDKPDYITHLKNLQNIIEKLGSEYGHLLTPEFKKMLEDSKKITE